MIPEFPKFKKLELDDRAEVEAITSKYPPYSDFNFTSMWCWDTQGKMQISELHGNLVVRFADYLTGKPFYSFLGNKKVNETAETLLKLAKKENVEVRLKLVPKDSIKDMDVSKFNVEEDRDNFDYIFVINSLSNYKNSEYSTKRNLVNRLLKKYPNTNSKIINLIHKNNQENILLLDGDWENDKLKKQKEINLKNESSALKRLFFLENLEDLICIGIYYENRLVGFSINEVLQSEYAISHFAKADNFSAGLYAYLMKETATKIRDRGKIFLDYEQDLGLLGLRYSKNSFRPTTFLNKYIITLLDD